MHACVTILRQNKIIYGYNALTCYHAVHSRIVSTRSDNVVNETVREKQRLVVFVVRIQFAHEVELCV